MNLQTLVAINQVCSAFAQADTDMHTACNRFLLENGEALLSAGLLLSGVTLAALISRKLVGNVIGQLACTIALVALFLSLVKV